MGLKAAVFCHNGLGDGVNCLVLSNNLHLNGWKVDTYQNAIGSMQNWFPHLNVLAYPPLSELPKILNQYDLFFVVQFHKPFEETSIGKPANLDKDSVEFEVSLHPALGFNRDSGEEFVAMECSDMGLKMHIEVALLLQSLHIDRIRPDVASDDQVD